MKNAVKVAIFFGVIGVLAAPFVWDTWQWPLVALGLVVALIMLVASCKGLPPKQNQFRINPMFDRNYKGRK